MPVSPSVLLTAFNNRGENPLSMTMMISSRMMIPSSRRWRCLRRRRRCLSAFTTNNRNANCPSSHNEVCKVTTESEFCLRKSQWHFSGLCIEESAGLLHWPWIEYAPFECPILYMVSIQLLSSWTTFHWFWFGKESIFMAALPNECKNSSLAFWGSSSCRCNPALSIKLRPVDFSSNPFRARKVEAEVL